uniref:SH3 domain-containing protein n=1 Tax=Acetatifactor sp. TaxID=1872090 RepID=UPI004055B1FE
YYPEAEAYLASQGIISADTTPSTETVAPAPAPEETAQPTYTIEDCDMNKYATTDVNVRTEPDANAGRVGSVPQNEQAHITGETSNGWYRLEYNGISGYSVSKYFADKPIEVIENVTDTPEATEVPEAVIETEETNEPVAEEPVNEEVTAEVPETTDEAVEEPVSDIKTEMIESVETTMNETTEVPVSEPAEEEMEEPTEEVAEPTEAVTESEPTAEEPTAEQADASATVPTEKSINVMSYLLIGAGIIVCMGAVTVVVLKRKK